MVERFEITEDKFSNVPMSSLNKPMMVEVPVPGTEEHMECQKLPYRELTGSLLYTLLTRPDIAFPVSSFSVSVWASD